jgi:hypothetical protein
MMLRQKLAFFLLCAPLATSALAVHLAAATTAFTYQGRLTNNGAAANGNYDFQFTLWDALTGGTQQPAPPLTVSKPAVSVANGVFTVQLDFGGEAAFPGEDRYLEIQVRPTGETVYTTLTPRQPITPNPYSIHTSGPLLQFYTLESGLSGNWVLNLTFGNRAQAPLSVDGKWNAGAAQLPYTGSGCTYTSLKVNANGNISAGDSHRFTLVYSGLPDGLGNTTYTETAASCTIPGGGSSCTWQWTSSAEAPKIPANSVFAVIQKITTTTPTNWIVAGSVVCQ